MKSLWMSDRDGLARYETIQNNYSLIQRRFEGELAKICRLEKVSLLPYSPIGGGVLSGKYLGGEWPTGARFTRYREGDKRTETMTRRFVNERTLATAARIAEIAASVEMSPVTFSIAWTLTRDYVASTIIGVTSLAQLGDHLAAAELQIPAEAMAAVDALASEIRHPME
jgi:aryl-alcohol dehydrogenase-like predicted oxidoreductase